MKLSMANEERSHEEWQNLADEIDALCERINLNYRIIFDSVDIYEKPFTSIDPIISFEELDKALVWLKIQEKIKK